MSWIPTVLIFGATALSLLGTWQSRAAWAAMASRLGLRLDNSWPAAPGMSGTIREQTVVVKSVMPNIEVQVVEVDPWFTLEKDSPMAQSTQPDIEVGDWGFDEVIRVHGDRDFAFGLLDDETRLAAEKVVLTWDGRVADGKIVVRVKEIRSVPHVLDALLTLAEKLQRPSTEEIPSRLARNALNDQSTGFRVQAFRHLATVFSDAPETLPTARTLLDSTEDALRLEAAKSLAGGSLASAGDEHERSLNILRGLASASGVEARVRCDAMDHLSRFAPHELALGVAEKILRRDQEPRDVRLSALDALAAAGAVDLLLRWHPGASPDGHPAETEQLAKTLGRCGEETAQPKLLELLEIDDVGIRIAAATALGVVGDVRAVPALRRVAGEKTLVKSPLARAVEEAVLQIQARAGGTQAGEISIVDPAPLEGAVSVAADEPDGPQGGEVSLALEEDTEKESAGKTAPEVRG